MKTYRCNKAYLNCKHRVFLPDTGKSRCGYQGFGFVCGEGDNTPDPSKPILCRECGKGSFTPLRSDKGDYYCSQECYDKGTELRYLAVDRETYINLRFAVEGNHQGQYMVRESGVLKRNFSDVPLIDRKMSPTKPGVYRLNDDGTFEELEEYDEIH